MSFWGGDIISPPFLFQGPDAMKSIIPLFFLILFVAFPAHSNPSNDWKDSLFEARTALKNEDASYAFYKLRNAWLAVPNKDLSADPYRQIRETLADTVAISPISKEELLIRDPNYSMEKIDKRFKQREFHSLTDEYSVEYRADDSLAFTRKGMDKPYIHASTCPEVISLNNVSPSELAKVNAEASKREKRDKEWYAQHMAKIRAQMPIVYKPNSSKYQDLLALCQPIKKGETKDVIGFDFNPFLPLDLKTIPDM